MRQLTRAALVAAAAAMLPAAAAADTLKVGLLLPYSSVYASLGNEITDGFNLALATYGEGLEISTVQEDTEVKPNVGLAKTRKLILQDEVDVIVGVVSSGVLGALRDFVHRAEVPLVVANAGNSVMTGASCSPYVIRVSFSNDQVNRPMGPWLYEQGVGKVYTLAPDYAAGRQMIEAFANAYTEAGGEIVGQAFTPFQDTKDFGPYLTAAQESGADALFTFYAGGEAIAFVKQYGDFGLSDSLPLYGSGFLTSPLYVAAQGPAADGVVTSLHYVPTIDTPENTSFRATYRERFEREPSEYAVAGYDAGRLVVEALRTAGGPGEAFHSALRTTSFTGPRGPLRIDPATNNVIQNIYVYRTEVAEDGTATQVILDTIEAVQDPPAGCEM